VPRARTGDPRAGVVYDRIWSAAVNSVLLAELFFWQWHLVRLLCLWSPSIGAIRPMFEAIYLTTAAGIIRFEQRIVLG